MTDTQFLPTRNGRANRRRTHDQILILAAYRLEEEHRAQWSPGDLAVAAARIAPERFCLRSADGMLYNHPSDNKVILSLLSSQPLQKRGLVENLRPSVYALTELGREEARKLAGGSDGQA